MLLFLETPTEFIKISLNIMSLVIFGFKFKPKGPKRKKHLNLQIFNLTKFLLCVTKASVSSILCSSQSVSNIGQTKDRLPMDC